MATNPLLALFGQAAGLQAPEAVGEEILVEGARQPTRAGSPEIDPYEGFLLGNADAIREREHAANLGAEAAGHEGMFGTKGTLRDILGVVGDAFLIQSGNNPMYAPKRQMERAGDAMTGFSRDPLAAAERMTGVSPEMSAELAKNYAVQQARQKANEIDEMQAGVSQMRALDSQAKNQDARYQDYAKLFSQYAGSATPETYSRIVPILNKLKERGGLGEEYIIPETYDENLMRTYQFGGMPATNQVSSGQRDEQLDISRHRAQTSRMNATRPRAAPRSRSQTALEYYQQIGNKPESQRTQAEKDFYKKYTSSGRSSGVNRRSVTPPSSDVSGSRLRLRGVRSAD